LSCKFSLLKMRIYIPLVITVSVLATSETTFPAGVSEFTNESTAISFSDTAASAASTGEQSWSRPRRRAGVATIGDTCWLSSLVQILLHSTSITRSLRNLPIESRRDEIVEGLKELDQSLWYGGSALPLVPARLLRGLQSVCGLEEDRQDAVEVLYCIISSLTQADRDFQRVFSFETLMNRKCSDCSTESFKTNPADAVLRLPIPSPTTPNGSVSLSECFEKFRASQDVQGVHCEHCEGYRESSIRYNVGSSGQVLFVALNRFDATLNRLNTPVSYSLVFENIDGYAYQLVGVVHNAGTNLSNGHYFVNYVDQHEKAWFHADDEKVTAIPELELVSTTAYLFVYERI
jgi:uncharacterized UBP type Zn finger protein